MFKTFVLATVATISLALTAGDFPMPEVPADFVAESYHYTYTGTRLVPTGAWSV